MDISKINAIDPLGSASIYGNSIRAVDKTESEQSFDSLLSSAMGLIKETDALSNKAEEEEIKYAMGRSDSIHDLQVAQQKASVSLQYTVAVKNAAVEAYKSIINMQF
ncbi:flagellar hook-basal body complex protein FliE [Eubacterium xylanophilum]|uniref:flagellar hook-basal body complex protein FliE n=1 Tax=Eubacterium xylanophilum TaxID=39497 RepID=UPI00047E0B1F|nr:flagellar hook-basal body complex protein FliE [Eubacterium xylanophilum]MCR5797223.1 flagellar hook-basal body complex protein FliE [Eubacterium sp.]